MYYLLLLVLEEKERKLMSLAVHLFSIRNRFYSEFSMNNRYVTTHLDDILAPKTTSAPSAANLDPITGAFPPKAHRGSAVCDFFANRTKFRNKSLLAVNRLEETYLNIYHAYTFSYRNSLGCSATLEVIRKTLQKIVLARNVVYVEGFLR